MENLSLLGNDLQKEFYQWRTSNRRLDNFTYEEFQRKYSCKTNFLNFYQVLNAIPQYLLVFKARNLDDILKNAYLEKSPLFQLLNGLELN